MKRRRIIAALAAIAAAACLISCMGNSPAQGKGPEKPGSSMPGKPGALEESGPNAVKAKAAELKTLRPYVDQGGDVETATDVAVYPDIGGKLVDLGVVLGDSVSKGQAIASIDPSKPGSSYAISPVTAPISGTVTRVSVDPGETVTTQTALIKIGSVDELKITIRLPERDSAKVKVGMRAKVSLAALPGESLGAEVAHVSPVLDPTSRAREVTLKLLSKDGQVAAGMYASARIFISPLVDRIAIPAAAVITRSDETFVFTVMRSDGGTVAKKTAVKVGTDVDGEVEAISGLKAGDKVVVEGQDQLSDGKKVEETIRSGE
jgi:membrane fusion protein, multidrug efflux system